MSLRSLTDLKARLQMMLRYGRALMVSRIANQRLANPLMPREPAHALPEWHRSGRAALNAAGGQVRTSSESDIVAKLATAFGKRPVTAKNLRSGMRQRWLTTPAPRIVVAPDPKSGNVIRLSALGTTSCWLAGHVDLEHLPSFEVDVQRAWPSVDRYNTAGKRGARPP